MEKENKIDIELLKKFFNKQCSRAEQENVISWFADEAYEQKLSFILKKYWDEIEYEQDDLNDATQRILSKIHKQIEFESGVGAEVERLRTYKPLKYLKYAAAIIGFTASLYFFTDSFRSEPVEIAPIVTDQTILTLEDGSQVALEKGDSFQTKNAKATGEEIIYQAGKDNTAELVYNYLTIPRGAQFSLQLPDGTQVWLNSDTQLKYPVQFRDGESRKVELVYGEAYFDVSPSSDHNGDDFKVLQNKQEVQVVGTQFNIKAYKEEVHVYTTLVEGKVNVNFKNMQQKLAPNQQTTYNIETGALHINDVEVDNIIAWKEGIFSFESMPLKEIMVVLARWYDIEVVFDNEAIENEVYTGQLRKDQDIEEILVSIKKFGMVKEYELKNNILTLK